jgi:hypothetical protein
MRVGFLPMDVSELRKRILRALDDAKHDVSSRRAVLDAAERDYGEFLMKTAVPLLKQTVDVLKAAGSGFVLHTPAASARLASEQSAETFLEFGLDRSTTPPQVVGRVSVARGRHRGMVERPLAEGKRIVDLTEDDVAAFLVAEIPKLVLKP